MANDTASAVAGEREDRDDEPAEVDPYKRDPGPEPDDAPRREPDNETEENPGEIRQMFLDWLAAHLKTVEVVGTKPTPWCHEWWLHPEVVARFKALWQARMQADASVAADDGDAGAVSSWWINHWDRHAAMIFDKGNGPFRDCDPTAGHLSRRKDKDRPVVPVSLPSDDVEL